MTLFKSACRGCTHVHSGSDRCYNMNYEVGSISLSPQNYNDFGTMWSAGSNKPFNFSMSVNCRCQYYVPTDNLEFLEWGHERNLTKSQQS